MTQSGSPTLSAQEARQLHFEALVIDAQQPPATSGFLFTDNMREALEEFHAQGISQREAGERLTAMAAREIQISGPARKQYLDFWAESGVNVASGTYAGPGPIEQAFERQQFPIWEKRKGRLCFRKQGRYNRPNQSHDRQYMMSSGADSG